MCKHGCPVYLASGSETLTPQKIARLILYWEKGFITDEPGFFKVMFQDALCGACRVNCIYDNFDLRDFIHKGRSGAFKKALLPEETRRRVEDFARFGNPDGERRLIQKGEGEVGYLVSCSTYRDGELLGAVEKVLAASGECQEFGGADICCGAPLYYAGDAEGFTRAAEKMKGEIEQRKLKKVITSCPACIKMMTELYPRVGVRLDVELVHLTEFIAALIKQGKIKVNRVKATATFHDPCILVNDIGVTAAPREVIEALGLEIKEPVYSGKNTHCCGGLPGGKIGDGKLSGRVSAMRVDELKETKADVYLSACPTCKAALAAVGMKDIAELVAEQISDG
jgi:Fe-S oxidoreductase